MDPGGRVTSVAGWFYWIHHRPPVYDSTDTSDTSDTQAQAQTGTGTGKRWTKGMHREVKNEEGHRHRPL
jgi:hypothetical protein